MALAAQKVFEDAMALPVDSRVPFVDKQLARLNLPTQEEIDRLWADEAERRVSQLDSTWGLRPSWRGPAQTVGQSATGDKAM